ncbi:MAG TPA: hypothetical protein VK745_12160, partial [Polyangiaceae bacterium]|nr:hypothetical protein [Polyangiaceae bacterium]
MTIEHNAITAANNHGIVSGLGPYTTAALRRAATVASTDVGKVALQSDTSPPTLWYLASQSSGVPTWVQISTAADASFTGNFGALFTGVLQYMRSDLGLIEATTLLHTAGTGPVLTFSGTRSGAATAITVTCPTTGGALGTWQGLVTYSDGSTQSFTSAATVALTGLGAGLTLNIAAGAAVTTDIWKAVAGTWADQSGNGVNVTAAGAPGIATITPGLNGHASLSSNGTSTQYGTYTLDLPAPGTTPTFFWAVCRLLSSPGAQAHLFGQTANGIV